MKFSALFYRLYHGQFPAEYRVLSSEAQVPVLDQAVYSESSIPATPPQSQSRQGWSYSILSWETKGGKSLLPSPCIIGTQEGQSPLLDTCKKHYSPEITCTRSGPSQLVQRVELTLTRRSLDSLKMRLITLVSHWQKMQSNQRTVWQSQLEIFLHKKILLRLEHFLDK